MALWTTSRADVMQALEGAGVPHASSPTRAASRLAAPPIEGGFAVRLIVGADRACRWRALAHALAQGAPDDPVVIDDDPAWWAFDRDPTTRVPPGATVVLLDVARAFATSQRGGTRLVLTHSLFSLPLWLGGLGRRGVRALLMEADVETMARVAPESFEGRGGWAHVQVDTLSGSAPQPERGGLEHLELSHHVDGRSGTDVSIDIAARLAVAYADATSLVRLERCRELADGHPSSAVAQLALASACMEVTALDAAQSALDRARDAAPEWGAVDYEQGKLHVRTERLDLAALAFAQAHARLPYFVPALVNLSAALGETGQTEAALIALETAAKLDPRNAQVLNNLGVTLRDEGRLNEAEAMFRRASTIAPDFVFAHYNLGHTLFLAGRFEDAISAYEGGQARDPHRNPVQAARLAFCRLAGGDTQRGLQELTVAIAALPPARRPEVVAEGLEVDAALRTLDPRPAGLDALRELLLAADQRIAASSRETGSSSGEPA